MADLNNSVAQAQTLLGQGHFQAALTLLNDPSLPAHLSVATLRGMALQKLGQLAEAVKAFQAAYALALLPNVLPKGRVLAARNFLSACLLTRDLSAAYAVAHDDLLLADNSIASLSLLAQWANHAGEHSKRVEYFTALKALRNDHKDHLELADALLELHRYAEASLAIASALRINPDSPLANMMLALDFPVVPRTRDEIRHARARYRTQMQVMGSLLTKQPNHPEWLLAFSRSCFYLNYHGEDDLALLREHQALQSRYLSHNTKTHKLVQKPVAQKIRLGVLSAHFYAHTVTRYFAEWLLQLDRSRFELILIDMSKWQDEVTEKLKRHADAHHHVYHSHDLNEFIAGLACDILLILDVGMAGRMMPLLSYRLAPVQCVTWGHPVTTAATEVDYYLSSAAQEPEEAEAHYSERLIRLPGLGICFRPMIAKTPAKLSFYGLSETRPLAIVGQSLFKLMPECDALFAAICARVPALQLVFFARAGEAIQALLHERMRAAFTAQGLTIDAHVRYLPTVSHEEFCALHQSAALSLDSLYFSGGNTSLDAFANACPVVTLPGRYMRGRQTAGMYAVMGFAELIAKDEADYVALACRLLTDPIFRAHCQDHIKAKSALLFNDSKAVRHFEAALDAIAKSRHA